MLGRRRQKHQAKKLLFRRLTMFESIKNYNDLKTLFNTSDKVFDIYGYLRCCSRYGEGEHLIITPSIEASKKLFVKFQQENKIGSFIRNRNIFKRGNSK